jgi:hypothetical protein
MGEKETVKKIAAGRQSQLILATILALDRPFRGNSPMDILTFAGRHAKKYHYGIING